MLLGFMGSGKTTVGRRAAELAGAGFCDLDVVIEREAGRTIAEIFRLEGEPAFRAREAAVLGATLAARGSRSIVAVGGGTPMDDVSWRTMREQAVTIWLDAPLAELLRRADAASRPMLHGRTPAQVAELFRSRLARYGQAAHRVDGRGTVEEVAREVVRLWDA